VQSLESLTTTTGQSKQKKIDGTPSGALFVKTDAAFFEKDLSK
jgi:hypothetical protein